MDVKQKLAEFIVEIDKKTISYFDKELKLDFGFNSKQKKVVQEALQNAKEFILRPQKHLRGSFVYYGAKLGTEELDEKIWKAAVAVEMVHGALLIHDDFMDQDDTRRGAPTMHEIYKSKFNDLHFGESMAVTVGDIVLCAGFELLASLGNTAVTKQMLRAIVNTAHGQAYDITLEQMRQWQEQDVIDLHYAKTGIYTYENPLLIGGMLAGIDIKALEILKNYSMDGGVAFQLQDDILGVFGTPEKTGKSADSDLKQGKCTLLVLKAFDCPEVQKVWGKMDATRKDLDAAKQAIINCGSYQYSKDLAIKYAKNASQTAAKLRDLNLNSEAIDYIQGIAEYMVKREV